MRCFSVKRLAILTKLTILARESDRNGRKRGKCSFHSVAVSSLFSKRFDERFNCGERKRRNQEKERLATLVSFRVSPRQKCTDEGEVVGNGNGNSIGRRAIGDERTNEPSMAHSIERKSRQTDFIPLSLSLSLSVSIFRNEPMSKWWYYWLIRLGSELRNRRGMEEREIHAIVSTQSYLASSLHRNSVSRPETSILFSISRKSGEKRQEEEEGGVSACSV